MGRRTFPFVGAEEGSSAAAGHSFARSVAWVGACESGRAGVLGARKHTHSDKHLSTRQQESIYITSRGSRNGFDSVRARPFSREAAALFLDGSRVGRSAACSLGVAPGSRRGEAPASAKQPAVRYMYQDLAMKVLAAGSNGRLDGRGRPAEKSCSAYVCGGDTRNGPSCMQSWQTETARVASMSDVRCRAEMA